MKVAILTLPLHSNYGGILQCYALQTILKRMGHDVKVLSKPRYGIRYYLMLPFIVFRNLFRRIFYREYVRIFELDDYILCENTDTFIKKYIRKDIRRKFDNSITKKYDIVIVGSDQIWRPKYSSNIECAFLSFLKDDNIKRISYAASFGVDDCEYTKEQLLKCSSFLKKFNAVSVREYSGISLCENYFGVDAVEVLDPTLLLSADDYRELINDTVTKPSKGNMLVYILNKTEEKINLVNRIAAERGLTPFWLDSPDEQNEKISLRECVKMSVEQWLRSFDEAEFVFTDSFHGCVFSIIFKKQFLAIGNEERGISRFLSLLNLFSLEERLILSYDEYRRSLSLINYEKIFDTLSVLQEQSISFLKANLIKE